MKNAFDINVPWVIATIRDQYYGLCTNQVKEIVRMPEIHAVPKSQEYVRGLIDIRGQIMPVIDLRNLFGIKTNLRDESNEIIELLNKREQDHKNWLNELEACINENREFKLQTNPHKCAFGLWYDNYKTSNQKLTNVLVQFDEPHKSIHAVAETVLKLVGQNKKDEALRIIRDKKHAELELMITLFAWATDIFKSYLNEYSVIIEDGGKAIALNVDSVDSVEMLAESSIEDISKNFNSDTKLTPSIGRRKTHNQMVLLIDGVEILSRINCDEILSAGTIE